MNVLVLTPQLSRALETTYSSYNYIGCYWDHDCNPRGMDIFLGAFNNFDMNGCFHRAASAGYHVVGLQCVIENSDWGYGYFQCFVSTSDTLEAATKYGTDSSCAFYNNHWYGGGCRNAVYTLNRTPSSQPTTQPTAEPSVQPSRQPSSQPSGNNNPFFIRYNPK